MLDTIVKWYRTYLSYGQVSSECISIEKHRLDRFLTSRVPRLRLSRKRMRFYDICVHCRGALMMQYYYAVACYNEITFQSISLSVIVPHNFVVYFNIEVATRLITIRGSSFRVKLDLLTHCCRPTRVNFKLIRLRECYCFTTLEFFSLGGYLKCYFQRKWYTYNNHMTISRTRRVINISISLKKIRRQLSIDK